jgi:hypothetical protein
MFYRCVQPSTSTLRQWCKRLTRLTYAFSKKWDNLKAALALHFAHYNFCRVHSSLRVTPAMEAGTSDHVWTIEELIGAEPMNQRVRYKKVMSLKRVNTNDFETSREIGGFKEDGYGYQVMDAKVAISATLDPMSIAISSSSTT